MKVFGINVAEGSDIKNLTVASGTSFPSAPNDAEMFYRADTDGSVRGLYVYINGAWDRIGSAAAVTVPANAPLPSTANMGDLFYLNSNDVTEGLYVYSGSSWVQATNPGSSPATATGDVTGTITPGANSPLTLASVGTAGTYFNVTTDVKGRVIYGSNPTTLTGFGITDAQPLDGDLTAIAALSGTSGYLKKTAANTYSLDTSTFITGNESITLSGDATGSGTTAITVTLASVGTAGSKGSASTVPVFVTDAKGRVTSSTDTSIAISASQTTSGTFADARIAQTNITQHQAALTILESQITDGTILARVGASETITGSWQFNNPVVVPTPVSGSSATTKDYVDQAIAGLSWKNSALVGTTANITLSGIQTIDGVSVVAGDRVLVKNQSTQSENGVYVVASGAWTRATDFDSVSPIDEINSAAVFVQLGSTQADTAWTQVSPVATVGTDAITFTQFAGANTFVAGAGLTLSGNTFNVGTANSANIVVNTDNIDLATIGTPVTDVLKRISTDSYGRVSATSAVQASDFTGVLDSVYVNITGDTMTGGLAINTSATAVPATLGLLSQAGQTALIGLYSGSSARWVMEKTGTAESGSNAGSDFSIMRHNDAGTLIDTPLTITRSTGTTTLTNTGSSPQLVLQTSAATGYGYLRFNNASAARTLEIITSTNAGAYGMSAGDGGINTSTVTPFALSVGDVLRLKVDPSTGHFVPGADNTQNFGSGSLRWANITASTFTGSGAVLSGTLQLTSTAAIHKVGNINFMASNGSTTNWLYAGSSNLVIRNQADTANLAVIDSTGITANLTGAASLNVLKAGDTMSGNLVHNNAVYLSGKTSAGTTTRLFGVNGSNNLYIGGIDTALGDTLFVNNGVEHMRWTSTGQFVVGTTVPYNNSKITSVTTTTQNGIGIDVASTTAGAYTGLYISRSASDGDFITMDRPAGTRIGGIGVSGTSLTISTNSVERMRIDSSGDAYIGVTSQLNSSGPTAKLNVFGTITAGTASSTTGSTILQGFYGAAGALTTFGSDHSSGGPVLGYAVTPSTTTGGTFNSSTTIAAPRSALIVADGIRFYTGAQQTVAIGSAVSTTLGMILTTGGRLGVGPAVSPRSPLDIVMTGGNPAGNWWEVARFVDASANKGISLGYDGSAQTSLIVAHGTASTNLAFWTYNGSSWDERMRLSAAGFLGIGQNNPQFLVDAYQTANDATMRVTSANAGAWFTTNNNAAYGGTVMQNGGVDKWVAGMNGADTYVIQRGRSGSVFTTIDTSGNMGIGITPTVPLHVSRPGDCVAKIASASTGSPILQLYAEGSNGAQITYDRASSKLNFQNSAGSLFQIDTAGALLVKSGSVYYGSSSSTFINGDNSNIYFGIGSAEKARFLSSGNLLLGTTTDVGTQLQVAGSMAISNSAGAQYLLMGNRDSSGANKPNVIISANAVLQFGTGNSWSSSTGGTFSEVCRLDSGNFLFATTNPSGQTTGISMIANNSTAGASYIQVAHPNGTGSGSTYANFMYNGSVIGTITQNGTAAVLYNTTSDERLKENIVDAGSAASKIDAIKVREFDFKTGDHVSHGFVAQELHEVVPEAVHVGGDDPTQDPWSVDPSKLVALLLKEVQELRARVAALEAR